MNWALRSPLLEHGSGFAIWKMREYDIRRPHVADSLGRGSQLKIAEELGDRLSMFGRSL